MIWTYREQVAKPLEAIVTSRRCLFCPVELTSIHHDHKRLSPAQGRRSIMSDVMVCSNCGWWQVSSTDMYLGGEVWIETFGTYGVLCNLMNCDIVKPVQRIERSLKSARRTRTAPQVLEELVARVFGEHGYSPVATGYEKHGGINLVMRDSSGATVGVRVRHALGRITVDQIVALPGVLMRKGRAKGVFILTACIQANDNDTPTEPLAKDWFDMTGQELLEDITKHKQTEEPFDVSLHRGVPRTLSNAQEFLERLGMRSRPKYDALGAWESVVGNVDPPKLGEVRA